MKFLSNPLTAKCLPRPNDEPVASLMYLDWISTLVNSMFGRSVKKA